MQSGPPSIKEALELARSVMLADRDLYEVGHSERLRYDEAIRNVEVALATFQPDGERREAIARAIAEKWPGDYMQGDDECEREPNALAHETADLILASGLVRDEAAIRDDERERCVAIISSPPNVPETHRFIFNGEVFKDSRGNELFIAKADVETLLNDFVAAIRSARNGGAES